MNHTNLEESEVSIAAVNAQRATLVKIISDRRAERMLIESNTNTAVSARDAAMAVLQDAVVRDALGEADATELATARAGIETANKALAMAREREGEVVELAAAENGLGLRVGALDVQLGELHQQRSDAKLEAIVAQLHQRIETYLQTAAVTARQFAEVLALDEHIGLVLGKPQNIRTKETPLACLPGFVGHTANAPDFDELMRQARVGIVAEHGTGLR